MVQGGFCYTVCIVMSPRTYIVMCLGLILAWWPLGTSAHQPNIVKSVPVLITQPEISRVFYDDLTSGPRTYRIVTTAPWQLYLTILTPWSVVPNYTYDVRVYDVQSRAPIDGTDIFADWSQYYESFAGDWYWHGPEVRRAMPAGTFDIVVSADNQPGTYALAIGEREDFDLASAISAIRSIPEIKSRFLFVSPATFLRSPFGLAYIVIIFGAAVAAGMGYRAYMRRSALAKVSVRASRNIGPVDRAARFSIGAILFIVAVSTTWNPIVLFISGFAFFETFAGWCGLYALVGKSTCPSF